MKLRISRHPDGSCEVWVDDELVGTVARGDDGWYWSDVDGNRGGPATTQMRAAGALVASVSFGGPRG
jgi:hypothetical protein